MKDFFISYTGKDKEWAEWIAWHLRAQGQTVTIQLWDFHPGSDLVLNMNDGVAKADHIIAVLSPDYFKSEYAKAEWAAALEQFKIELLYTRRIGTSLRHPAR